MGVAKAWGKNYSNRRLKGHKMAERFTAEQVLELLNDDFDVSGGNQSDFEEDGIYSYSGESVDILELEASQSQETNCSEEEQELVLRQMCSRA